jgi:outer membrane protein assembly factor BamB
MPWLRSWLALLTCTAVAGAGDWPQWLGPARNGSSPETVTPWKEAPRVAWRQAVGEGHSSPVVAGGRVFLHTKVSGKDEEQVTAWDAATGKQAWQMIYPRAAFKSVFGNGPRATPAVAGNKVYTFGVTGILTCWEAATGKQVWQVDTLKKFEASNLFFGTSCSPLVDGERLFLNVGGKGASLVAFNKGNGETLWKNLDDRASYASPVLLGEGPTRQLVFFTQQGQVALNPADGTVFWKYPLVDILSESSTTPVVAGSTLFASSITAGGVGLRLDSKDGKPAAQEAWKNPALTCYFSTPVAVGKEYLFLVTGTKPPALSPQADLRCVEAATGKELWRHPKVGKYHASLLRTGDNKLLMLEEGGELVLLEANPQEYKELCRAKVCGPDTWSHPALANGRLYIRDRRELICLQMSP